MCTALSFVTRDHYFGRTLDLEYSYHETVTLTPRNFPLAFRRLPAMNSHYAIIGMAYVADDYPLYYDAANEHGLAMAGLNFPGNAAYLPPREGCDNVAPFEFIPWVLGQCKSVAEARALLSRINLANISFSDALPASPLHFMIADRDESIVAEPVKDGVHVYDNPVGVMTNNPTFDMQLWNLNNYMALDREPPRNTFGGGLPLTAYSRGMGALGLPGDLSSASRFVKAAFTKLNSVCGEGEEESVTQFFHILGSVCQQRGCVHMGEGKYEITIYTSCCNTATGVYYYTTYGNSQITAIDMRRENLDGDALRLWPLVTGQQIRREN